MKQNISLGISLVCMAGFLAYDYEAGDDSVIIPVEAIQVHYKHIKTLDETCALEKDDVEWLELTSDLSGWLKMDRLCTPIWDRGKVSWGEW